VELARPIIALARRPGDERGRGRDLAAQALEQCHRALADLRVEQVDEAGDEELDAGDGQVTKATENAAGSRAAGGNSRCLQAFQAVSRSSCVFRETGLREGGELGLMDA
jgi:hypothetical protein